MMAAHVLLNGLNHRIRKSASIRPKRWPTWIARKRGRCWPMPLPTNQPSAGMLLTALAAMDHVVAYEALNELLHVSVPKRATGRSVHCAPVMPPTRLVRGEYLGGDFAYHVISSSGPDLIHICQIPASGNRRLWAESEADPTGIPVRRQRDHDQGPGGREAETDSLRAGQSEDQRKPANAPWTP